jgi:uncharacterized membrane protein
MNSQKNTSSPNRKHRPLTLVFYIASLVIGLIGIASLINNISLYNKTIAQYVGQGYPASDVISQLLPSQLLPGVFEAIALYGGIALLLFGIGLIYEKIFNSQLSINALTLEDNLTEAVIVEENSSETDEIPVIEVISEKVISEEKVSDKEISK